MTDFYLDPREFTGFKDHEMPTGLRPPQLVYKFGQFALENPVENQGVEFRIQFAQSEDTVFVTRALERNRAANRPDKTGRIISQDPASPFYEAEALNIRQTVFGTPGGGRGIRFQTNQASLDLSASDYFGILFYFPDTRDEGDNIQPNFTMRFKLSNEWGIDIDTTNPDNFVQAQVFGSSPKEPWFFLVLHRDDFTATGTGVDWDQPINLFRMRFTQQVPFDEEVECYIHSIWNDWRYPNGAPPIAITVDDASSTLKEFCEIVRDRHLKITSGCPGNVTEGISGNRASHGFTRRFTNDDVLESVTHNNNTNLGLLTKNEQREAFLDDRRQLEDYGVPWEGSAGIYSFGAFNNDAIDVQNELGIYVNRKAGGRINDFSTDAAAAEPFWLFTPYFAGQDVCDLNGGKRTPLAPRPITTLAPYHHPSYACGNEGSSDFEDAADLQNILDFLISRQLGGILQFHRVVAIREQGNDVINTQLALMCDELKDQSKYHVMKGFSELVRGLRSETLPERSVVTLWTGRDHAFRSKTFRVTKTGEYRLTTRGAYGTSAATVNLRLSNDNGWTFAPVADDGGTTNIQAAGTNTFTLYEGQKFDVVMEDVDTDTVLDAVLTTP